MSPRLEREAAMDEVADYAAQAFARLPRDPARRQIVGFSGSMQMTNDSALNLHLDDYDRTEQAAMNPRSCIDADCAAVLDELVERGDLDSERIEDMLQDAAAKRENRPRVPDASKQRLLKALGELIEAAEGTLDYSTKLRGAIARAHTAFVGAGGVL